MQFEVFFFFQIFKYDERGSIRCISKFLIFENFVSIEDDWRMLFIYDRVTFIIHPRLFEHSAWSIEACIFKSSKILYL